MVTRGRLLSFRGKGILEMQIFEERVLVNKLWLGFLFIYLFNLTLQFVQLDIWYIFLAFWSGGNLLMFLCIWFGSSYIISPLNCFT